jgi:hypothetical protein
MTTKIVTAYWMDVENFPFQGTRSQLKTRYLGSLISHCRGINFPVICYTHEKNKQELIDLKNEYNLNNLEIKILELHDMKCHKRLTEVRENNYDENLNGRGPEIMWGKFDVIERELGSCDRIYWIDVGLQHAGIFPWMYCVPYGERKYHIGVDRPIWADCEITQYDFTKLFNTKIFEKLNIICEGKVVTLASTSPQIGYPFSDYGVETKSIESPYPIGGLIGGDTKEMKKYLNSFWETCEKVMDKNFYCTEEAIMKIAHDLNKEIMLPFTFGAYQNHDIEEFHFNLWNDKLGTPKPLYMVWHDILNY